MRIINQQDSKREAETKTETETATETAAERETAAGPTAFADERETLAEPSAPLAITLGARTAPARAPPSRTT